jgi:hypothetical protein
VVNKQRIRIELVNSKTDSHTHTIDDTTEKNKNDTTTQRTYPREAEYRRECRAE